jgi:hypothetical protein
MKDKDFSSWNNIKEQLHNDKINFRFRERDIFFMYVGANIGFEQDGGKDFLRPVLVYKKFNKHVFLGIPLTSQVKFDANLLKLIVTPLEDPKGAHEGDL